MQAINKNKLNLCGIYMILNTANNKKYIGSSSNIGIRLWKHRSLLRHNKHFNAHLQASWNKYGEDNFQYSILESCSQEEQFIREQFYINLLSPEYNICKDVIEIKIAEESKRKMSESRKEGLKAGAIPITNNIPVYVYYKDGSFVGMWPSIAKACRALHLHKSSGERVISGKAFQARGYRFFRTKQEKVIPFEKPTNSGKLDLRKTFVFYDDSGNTLKFLGLDAAANYFNVSIKSLRQYTTGKHKFKRKYMIKALNCRDTK